MSDTVLLLPAAGERAVCNRRGILFSVSVLAAFSFVAAAAAQGAYTHRGDPSSPTLQCDSVPEPNGTAVYFGNGCFWERQWAYVVVEREELHRSVDQVSAVTGYAGGQSAPTDTVCYHTDSPATDYEALGHAEVVRVTLDPPRAAEQLAALADDFFGSFTGDVGQRARPDPMDRGSPYRSLIGLPGGLESPLYPIVARANAYGMELRPGSPTDADPVNVVWVVDSTKYPFFRAELYHQFHSNFFQSEGMPYPGSYTQDLYLRKLEACVIAPVDECPPGRHW